MAGGFIRFLLFNKLLGTWDGIVTLALEPRWNEIVTGQADAGTAERVRSNLLAYCGLDTRAMVEIWKELCRAVEPVRREL